MFPTLFHRNRGSPVTAQCLDEGPTGCAHIAWEAAEVALPIALGSAVRLPPCVLKDTPAELSFCPNGVCWAVTVRKCTPRTAPSLSKAHKLVKKWCRNKNMPSKEWPPGGSPAAGTRPAPRRVLCRCPRRLPSSGCYFWVCLHCLLDGFSYLWKLFGYLWLGLNTSEFSMTLSR